MRIFKTKRCKRCKEEKRLCEFPKHPSCKNGRAATCSMCVYARNKFLFEQRKSKRRPQSSYKEKARRIYQDAKANGKIVLKQCSVTGCNRVNNLHGHHFNYKKPLMVIPLCDIHHREVHSLWAFKQTADLKLVIELEKKE